MVQIGKAAPALTGQAIVNGCIKTLSLDDFGGNYKIIFFYPLDFTFVCPTELHAFQESLLEFSKRNCVIIGVSVDSVYTHFAWLNTAQEQGGIEGITFPLVGDITKTIARDYGVLDEEEGIAWRGTFLLDKKNIVHAAHINAAPLGRSVDELLRLLDALQFVESHGEVCPANWQRGEQGIIPNAEGIKNYLCKNKK